MKIVALCTLSTGLNAIEYAIKLGISIDKIIGLNSSAISLGKKSIKTVSFCYFLTSFFLAFAASKANLGLIFWPFWLITTLGMQREVFLLNLKSKSIKTSGLHFINQVRLGSLLLLGMILSKLI